MKHYDLDIMQKYNIQDINDFKEYLKCLDISVDADNIVSLSYLEYVENILDLL